MKLRGIAFLAVRIISIYLFITGVNHLINLIEYTIPAFFQFMKRDTNVFELFLLLGLPALIFIFCGIFMWMCAGRISLYLIPRTLLEDEIEDGFRSKQIEGFVLSVIGLILLISSSTSLVRMLIQYFTINSQGVTFNQLGYGASLVEQIIRLILGILLLVKAEGFALWLRKLRAKQT